MKVRTMIYPMARGAWNPRDIKNCTVRALVNATGMDLLEATDLLAKYGREHNKGTFNFHAAYIEAGLELIGVYGTTGQARGLYHNAVFGEAAHMNASYPSYMQLQRPGTTLGKFIKEHQEGSYIIAIKGHTLALVDGETIDSHPTSAAVSVLMVYKVK